MADSDEDSAEEDVADMGVPSAPAINQGGDEEGEDGGRRKRRRNQKYYSVNYTRDIGSDVDSDVDMDFMRDDSEDEAVPKKRSKAKAKAARPPLPPPVPNGAGAPLRSKQCPQCGHQVGRATKICSQCSFDFTQNKSRSQPSLGALAAATYSDVMFQQNGYQQPPPLPSDAWSASSLPPITSNEVPRDVSFDAHTDDDGTRVIEKIMGRRFRRRLNVHNKPEPCKANEETEAEIFADVFAGRFEYEYLVKWRGLSYLHMEWMVAEDLECLALRSRQTFSRFLKRLQQQADDGEAPPRLPPCRDSALVPLLKATAKDKAAQKRDLAAQDAENWLELASQTVDLLGCRDPERIVAKRERDVITPDWEALKAKRKAEADAEAAAVAAEAEAAEAKAAAEAAAKAAAEAAAKEIKARVEAAKEAEAAAEVRNKQQADEQTAVTTEVAGTDSAALMTDETPADDPPVPSSGTGGHEMPDAAAGGADQAAEELPLVPGALYTKGATVEVARHDRVDPRSESRKTVFGGAAFVTEVHAPGTPDEAPTYSVRYILGGTDIALEQAQLTSLSNETSARARTPSAIAVEAQELADLGSSRAAAPRSGPSRPQRGGRNSLAALGGGKLSRKEIWRPIERCAALLERCETDPLAAPFLEAVSLEQYPDYEEAVDNPMDLGTMRAKIDQKQYRSEADFIRDLRLVWSNCKRYNSPDSAIWYAADLMAKTCERLYQAWVLAFDPDSHTVETAAAVASATNTPLLTQTGTRRARAVSASDLVSATQAQWLYFDEPVAKPWEQSCRACSDQESDHALILCDHCDAHYHTHCLQPPLQGIPDGAWYCPVCATLPWHMQSATFEEEVRDKMEALELPPVRKRVTEYLVKWQGLSYGEATWELAEDINDDEKISEYEQRDGKTAMPPVTYPDMVRHLARTPHVVALPISVPSQAPDSVRMKQKRRIKAIDSKQEGGSDSSAVASNGQAIDLNGGLEQVADAENASDAEGELEGDDETGTWTYWDAIPEPSWSNPCPIVNGTSSGPFDGNPAALVDHGLKCQLYAQIRLAHYLTQGEHLPLPSELLLAAGPATAKKVRRETLDLGAEASDDHAIRAEVSDILVDLVHDVARGVTPVDQVPAVAFGEYTTIVPKLSAGFLMNICDQWGCIKVSSCRGLPTGGISPVEAAGVGAGDVLRAFNDTDVSTMPFNDACRALNDIKPGSFVKMQFLRSPMEPELRPDMRIEHATDETIITPGEPSSRFRGVFRRTGKWEVALCLHAKVPSNMLQHSSIYKVVGIIDNEVQAALAHDYHLSQVESLLWSTSWRFKMLGRAGGDGRMTVQERKMYMPRTFSERQVNFGPNGIYGEYKPDSVFTVDGMFEVPQEGAGSDDEEPECLIEARRKEEARIGRRMKRLAEKEERRKQREEAADDGWKPGDDSADDEEEEEEEEADYGESDMEQSLDKEHEEDEEDENEDENEDEGEEEAAADVGEDDDEGGQGGNGKVKNGTTPTKGGKKANRRVSIPQQSWAHKGPMEQALFVTRFSNAPPENGGWLSYGVEGYAAEVAEFAKEEAEASAAMDSSIADSTNVAAEIEGDWEGMVAQIDADTGNTLHIWPSAAAAAEALKLPIEKLQNAIKGAEGCDMEVGYYRWAPFTPKQTAGEKSSNPAEYYASSKVYKGGNQLRDYQLSGLNWMIECFHGQRSCILADEMGLGKTVQVVSFLEHLYSVEDVRGPFLVVVPLSTLGHWQREIRGWTNMECCMYHDRGKDMRQLIRAFEWFWPGAIPGEPSDELKFQILVTTYEEVIKDVEELAGVAWRSLVVDEAHRLKGLNSKLLECLHQILPKGMRQYGFQHKVLMTGTPLQNNTQELWSLLHFIDTAKFPSLDKFQELYKYISSEQQVRELQGHLMPHLLRRVKEDVANDIPPKSETVIDVELTTIQKQYYRAIFEKNQAFLYRGAGKSLPKLMNIQMELRKCCNHPHLIDGVEEREQDALVEELSKQTAGASIDKDIYDKEWADRCLLRSSGKMVLLDKLLPKLRREGHKVLIFSQMVKVLNILEDFLEYRNFNFERLDGNITGNRRQAAIDRFNESDDSFIFLLSTRAGGVGINLTAADTVIIFDSDWNPQNDVQAQARCHRIGQTKEVMVYRLVMRRSFESEMFNRASRKLGLERAVLGTADLSGKATVDDDEETSNGNKISGEELEQLLRQGAYALMDDDGDEETQQFCENDIDTILETRSHVRVVEGSKTAEWLSKGKEAAEKKATASIKNQNRLTKSSFTAETSEKHADVAVDDPNFWAKVMPGLKSAAVLKTRLEDVCARRNKRLQVLRAAQKLVENEQEDEILVKQEESEDRSENGETELSQGDLGSASEEGAALKVHDGGVKMEVDTAADTVSGGGTDAAGAPPAVAVIVKPPPLSDAEIAEAEAEDAAAGADIFNEVEELAVDAVAQMRKGKLSEIERKDLLAVLLHITVTDSSIIPEACASQAEVWRQSLEGKRKRTAVDYKSQGVAYQDMLEGVSGGGDDPFQDDVELGGRSGRASGAGKGRGRGGKKSRVDDGAAKGRARRTNRRATPKGSLNDDEEWDFEKDDETTVIYNDENSDRANKRARRSDVTPSMVAGAVGGVATNVDLQVKCDSCQNWFGQDQHGLDPLAAASLDTWYCAGCTDQMQGLANMCEAALPAANAPSGKAPGAEAASNEGGTLGKELFCVCRTEEDPEATYIGCDRCDQWFHPECVGVTSDPAVLQSPDFSFVCPSCKGSET